MKNFILTAGTLLSVWAGTTANAQSSVKAEIRDDWRNRKKTVAIGPVGSIGSSYTTGMYANSVPKLSGAIGVGMTFSKMEHWGTSLQVLVSAEGSRGDAYYMAGMPYGSVATTPVYLRIPWTFNYYFGRYGQIVRPKLYAGPNLGIKLFERSDAAAGSDNDYTTNIYRPVDFGIQAGGGVNIRIARATWLNMDLGFYQGLVDAVRDNADNGYNTNQNLRFNVGVLFGM